MAVRVVVQPVKTTLKSREAVIIFRLYVLVFMVVFMVGILNCFWQSDIKDSRFLVLFQKIIRLIDYPKETLIDKVAEAVDNQQVHFLNAGCDGAGYAYLNVFRMQ